MIRIFLFSLCTLCLVLSGCDSSKPSTAGTALTPESEIVKKVEAAGAGDVASASGQAIEHWFAQHKNVAVEIASACRPIRKTANVAWGDSVEAKVCNAAVGPATFAPITVQGTGKKY